MKSENLRIAKELEKRGNIKAALEIYAKLRELYRDDFEIKKLYYIAKLRLNFTKEMLLLFLENKKEFKEWLIRL